MTSELYQKSVVILGGTGSLGRVLTDRLLSYPVSRLTIFSRDEQKQDTMRREVTDLRVRYAIGDIRDMRSVREVIQGSDIVYHVAALKIIPLMEVNPVESLKTNVLGALNVKDACLDIGVERAIFVSTDKAVKPVNVYGLCKALSEKIWLSPNYHGGITTFNVVRYGNVATSRGSVIPLFKELVKAGKPLTVTDPNMTRFMFSLPQALELIMRATLSEESNLIFVPKIPACTVSDLVQAIGGKDYPTVQIGVRPGEKIHECLISEEEALRTEDHDDYFRIHQHRVDPHLAKELTSDDVRRLRISEIKEMAC